MRPQLTSRPNTEPIASLGFSQNPPIGNTSLWRKNLDVFSWLLNLPAELKESRPALNFHHGNNSVKIRTEGKGERSFTALKLICKWRSQIWQLTLFTKCHMLQDLVLGSWGLKLPTSATWIKRLKILTGWTTFILPVHTSQLDFVPPFKPFHYFTLCSCSLTSGCYYKELVLCVKCFTTYINL